MKTAPFRQRSQSYLVAEAEINHNGQLDTAMEMVSVAKSIGADAIKFQYIIADEITTRDHPQYPVFKRVELPFEGYREIFSYAGRLGIDCFMTVPSLGTLEPVLKLDPAIIKIGSTNITNLPLLREVGKSGIPVLISTGTGSLGEVEKAMDALGATPDKVGIFHCTVKYPAPLGSLNLRAIATLKAAFPGYTVGFSDHSEGEWAAIGATVLGSEMIEKHFTLSHDQEGQDHGFSADPEEFRRMVEGVRGIELALGDGVKRAAPEEARAILAGRRYIVAAQEIAKGELITQDKLALRRIPPEKRGLEPECLDWIDRWAAPRSYAVGEPLYWDDFRG